MTALTASKLKKAKTIVIKFGSNIIRNADAEWFENLAQNIAELKSQGKNIIIVTSGAIAIGRKKLALPAGELALPEKQAAAMAGQPILMESFRSALDKSNLVAGQSLLTHFDMSRSQSKEDAKNALFKFLKLNGIPVCNENDVTSTDEITIGDNDGLATHLAIMIHADALILFSTIDGFYKECPIQNPNAEMYETIYEIVDEHWRAVGKIPKDSLTTGGGNSKLTAAYNCMGNGVTMVLTNGEKIGCLAEIIGDPSKPSTAFIAAENDNTQPEPSTEMALRQS
ncbi:glutamate 5-kinase [Alphaproteobacteria bacterium]|nr:glutamate 5-kinase [Alphaproteobacteria bacterium]